MIAIHSDALANSHCYSLYSDIAISRYTPELYSVSPDWLEYYFIYEKLLVACREFLLLSE
jgi:hypothetical protein